MCFDDFKISQFVPYTLFVNSLKMDKLSHAYIINGCNNDKGFDFVISLAKMILCDKHYSNFDRCNNCDKCMRIDSNNYTEFKIIESDSFVIKKEDIIDLKSNFSKLGVEGKKRVYVIKDCDKMNRQASNSLLKFIEEPDDNVIALLYTNHINNMLDTIVSRCQVINLINENDNYSSAIDNFAHLFCKNDLDIINFKNNDLYNDMINTSLKFVSYFEDNGLDVILYLNNMWFNIFNMRQDCLFGVSLILNFYYDVFKFKYGFSNFFFSDYIDLIEKVSNLCDIDNVNKKIDICLEKIDELKLNLNINLLVDDLIIKFSDL